MNKPVRLIEVIGPAGAGKSTLGQILSQTNQISWVRTAPDFRRAEDFTFFVKNTSSMARTLFLFYIHKNGRWFTPEEIVWLVILNGWSNKLMRHAENTGKTILLDEGPIFHLAYLFMRGPETLRSSSAQTWWRKICWQIANTTDVIVWLDAPNNVLLRRIRTRKKWYIFESATDAEIYDFLDKLRKSYSHCIQDFLTQKSTLKVLMFDTGKEHMDKICEQIIDATREC